METKRSLSIIYNHFSPIKYPIDISLYGKVYDTLDFKYPAEV